MHIYFWERIIFYAYFLTAALFLYALHGVISEFVPDIPEPLSETQVKKGVGNWLVSEKPGEEIYYIIERKGDEAGEIGYYYVQLRSGIGLIVPSDARFEIDNGYRARSNYLEFYERGVMHINLPTYDANVSLKIYSWINFVLGRKNANQRWWDRVINTK